MIYKKNEKNKKIDRILSGTNTEISKQIKTKSYKNIKKGLSLMSTIPHDSQINILSKHR